MKYKKMKYRVYEVSPTDCYGGYALIAASTADEANYIIKQFKKDDIHNNLDSIGFGRVTEDDRIVPLESKQFGIIVDRIYYAG